MGAQSRKHALYYYVEEEGCDQLVKTSSRCGFVFFCHEGGNCSLSPCDLLNFYFVFTYVYSELISNNIIILCYLSLNIILETVSRGALRLVRYEQPSLTQAWSSGIVQVYYNDNWGNICDDTSFGITEADVICHQLSYTGASSYTNTAWSTRYNK